MEAIAFQVADVFLRGERLALKVVVFVKGNLAAAWVAMATAATAKAVFKRVFMERSFRKLWRAAKHRRTRTVTQKSLSTTDSHYAPGRVGVCAASHTEKCKVWTLAAWCERRHDFRTFRMDRIGSVCAVAGRTGEFRDEPGKTLADYLRAVAPPQVQAKWSKVG